MLLPVHFFTFDVALRLQRAGGVCPNASAVPFLSELPPPFYLHEFLWYAHEIWHGYTSCDVLLKREKYFGLDHPSAVAGRPYLKP